MLDSRGMVLPKELTVTALDHDVSCIPLMKHTKARKNGLAKDIMICDATTRKLVAAVEKFSIGLKVKFVQHILLCAKCSTAAATSQPIPPELSARAHESSKCGRYGWNLPTAVPLEGFSIFESYVEQHEEIVFKCKVPCVLYKYGCLDLEIRNEAYFDKFRDTLTLRPSSMSHPDYTSKSQLKA